MITISRVQPGEETTVCALIRASFEKHVAPFYSKEGVEAFYQFADPKSMAKRQFFDAFILLARNGKNILGAMEVRDWRHISMLFIIPHRKRADIARMLLRRAESICKAHEPSLSHLDINASLYAVEAYKKLGFVSTGVPVCVDGVPFMPMCKPLI